MHAVSSWGNLLHNFKIVGKTSKEIDNCIILKLFNVDYKTVDYLLYTKRTVYYLYVNIWLLPQTWAVL